MALSLYYWTDDDYRLMAKEVKAIISSTEVGPIDGIERSIFGLDVD